MFTHHHLGTKKSPEHFKNPLEVDPHTQTMPIEELEDYYRHALQKTFDQYKQKFEQNSEKAEGEFVQFLADLQVRAQQTDNLIESVKKERIDTLFNTLENRLTTVIDETVTRTLATIQKELEDSHIAVQTYTNKQLSLIDQNAIDLLEKTLSIVLIKKMSLRDQLDLVYEALEKAKLEKFLSSSQVAVPTNDLAPSGSQISVPTNEVAQQPEDLPAGRQASFTPPSFEPTPTVSQISSAAPMSTGPSADSLTPSLVASSAPVSQTPTQIPQNPSLISQTDSSKS